MEPDWLDDLGKAIVNHVRDEAIAEMDRTFDVGAQDLISRRWKRILEKASPNEFGKHIVPDCVDAAICALLRAIETGRLRMKFEAGDGREIDLEKDGKGELVGWYMGTWKEEMSTQRSYDDFSDL